MKLPAFALLLLLGLPGTARAGEIVVAPGAVFTYSDPAGFCLVDPAMSSDEGNLFSMAQGSIGARSRFHLQILLVDCDWLTALRTSEAALPTELRGIGWAIEQRDGQAYQFAESRRDYVAERAAGLKEGLRQAVEIAAKQRDMDPADMSDMLADDSDPDAFVFAVATRDATDEVGVAVGVTMIQGYGIIPLSLHSPLLVGGLAPQIDEVRALARDLIARNDPEGAGRGGGLGALLNSPWLKGLLFLSIALGAAAFFFKRRKARPRG